MGCIYFKTPCMITVNRLIGFNGMSTYESNEVLCSELPEGY